MSSQFSMDEQSLYLNLLVSMPDGLQDNQTNHQGDESESYAEQKEILPTAKEMLEGEPSIEPNNLKESEREYLAQMWRKIIGEQQVYGQFLNISIDPEVYGDKFPTIFRSNSKKMAKNNNVPKHLMKRIVQLYNTKGSRFFKADKKILTEVNKFMNTERKKYREEKNWNNNLGSMRKIFGPDGSSPKIRSLLMRKMAHHLIRSEIIPSIKTNPQISSMLPSYMLTLKVQLLRTRNWELMTRTETH